MEQWGDKILHAVFPFVRDLSVSVTGLAHPPDLGDYEPGHDVALWSPRPELSPVPPAFDGKRLYAGPSVHYRDETDISGLVAPGDRPIADNPTMVRRHPVGHDDREQVTVWCGIERS
jgi:hypothetical protein